MYIPEFEGFRNLEADFLHQSNDLAFADVFIREVRQPRRAMQKSPGDGEGD